MYLMVSQLMSFVVVAAVCSSSSKKDELFPLHGFIQWEKFILAGLQYPENCLELKEIGASVSI
jgi:hypothetical protein